MFYHNAEIEKGKLIVDQKSFLAGVKSCFDGNYLLLLIKQTDRTEREWQKFYRVILGEMSNYLGYTKDEMHELAKTNVLVEMGFDSTTQLSPEDWMIYMEKLGDWSHEKFDFIF